VPLHTGLILTPTLTLRAGDEGQDWALWEGVVVQLPGGGVGVVQAAGADGVCTVAAAAVAEDGTLSVPFGAPSFSQARARLGQGESQGLVLLRASDAAGCAL